MSDASTDNRCVHGVMWGDRTDVCPPIDHDGRTTGATGIPRCDMCARVKANGVNRYAITVRVVRKLPTGYERGTDSPTFYLDPNVQGIVSEDHAKRIVEHWMTDLLADTHEPSTTGIYVTAVAL